MKRKIFLIILWLSFALGIFYLQFSRKPTVDSVITSSDNTGYASNLTVIANKLVILDQDKLQQDLINHITNNDFENMMFSYDVMGYPKECTVTVYTNDWTKKLGIPAFTFKYAPISQMQSTLPIYIPELPQIYPRRNVA